MSNVMKRNFALGPWFCIYATTIMLAIGIDLLTDRSFGAFMFSTLPVSSVSFACLVVGPWLNYPQQKSAFTGWFLGALWILIVTLIFVSLGEGQAKDGEVVFTYALLILSFPSSLILPFVSLDQGVLIRILASWLTCVCMGYLEWKVLNRLAKT